MGESLFDDNLSLVPMADKSFVQGMASGSGTYLVRYSKEGKLLEYRSIVPPNTIQL